MQPRPLKKIVLSLTLMGTLVSSAAWCDSNAALSPETLQLARNFGRDIPAAKPISLSPVLTDGFYVGVSGAYSYTNLKYRHVEHFFDHTYKLNRYLPSLGVLVGFGMRYQDNYFAGEVSWHHIFSHDFNGSTPIPHVFRTNYLLAYNFSSQLSFSALYGRYYSRRLLFFGRVGLGVAKVDSVVTKVQLYQHPIASDSGLMYGAILGIGMQYALYSKLSARFEYDYTYYFQREYSYLLLGQSNFSYTDRYSMVSHSINASLIYTF